MTRGPVLVDFRLYLITDRWQTAGRDLFSVVEEALIGGVRAVQLREKGLPASDNFDLAIRMRSLTDRYGARLMINDRIDIALAAGADGVHLPETGLPVAVARELLGPDKLIGVSCHSREQALAVESQGADFITYGPVFFTPSKAPYGKPVGIDRLAEVAASLAIPVFALGGVSLDRVPALLSAGSNRVALISAILAAPEPRTETEAFCTLLDQAA